MLSQENQTENTRDADAFGGVPLCKYLLTKIRQVTVGTCLRFISAVVGRMPRAEAAVFAHAIALRLNKKPWEWACYREETSGSIFQPQSLQIKLMIKLDLG